MNSHIDMSPGARQKIRFNWRPVAQLHHWLGIALGSMFAIWFFTGTVQSFVPFPALGAGARIAGADRLATDRIRIDPATAIARADATGVRTLRIRAVGDTPRYILTLANGQVQSINAITGEFDPPLDARTAMAIASRFSGRHALTVDGPWDYDQWIIHDKYPPFRPYFRVRMDDAAATDLYVSARSGDVMQRTNRRERFWNRLGAVVHWLNVPALRVNRPAWQVTMWLVAFGGLVLVSAGLLLGVRAWLHQRNGKKARMSPYSGWLRLHHVFGLFAGCLLLGWILSGWLSVDAELIFPAGTPTRAQALHIEGMPVDRIAEQFPAALLRSLPAAREYQLRAFAGHPYIYSPGSPGQPAAILVPGGTGQFARLAELPEAWIRAAVAQAFAPARVVTLQRIAADDIYQRRAEPWPPHAWRAVLGDAAQTWVHVDAASGDVISVMGRGRRVYRWLVEGLHTLDFPVFDRTGNSWRLALLAGTTTGFLFSGIAVALGARRLRRSWRSR